MSMKRSRSARGAGGKNAPTEADGFAFGKVPDAPPKWSEIMTDKPDGAFKPYSVTTSFARNDLVLHPKFGKGVVTQVDGARVEVLFEEGAKKLGHAG